MPQQVCEEQVKKVNESRNSPGNDETLFRLLGVPEGATISKRSIDKAYWKTLLKIQHLLHPKVGEISKTIMTVRSLLIDSNKLEDYLTFGRDAVSEPLQQLDWPWLEACVSIIHGLDSYRPVSTAAMPTENATIERQSGTPDSSEPGSVLPPVDTTELALQSANVSIVDHRYRYGKLKFKIRLDSWHPDSSSWTPLEQIVTNHPSKLSEYLGKLAANQPRRLRPLATKHWAILSTFMQDLSP